MGTRKKKTNNFLSPVRKIKQKNELNIHGKKIVWPPLFIKHEQIGYF